MYAGFAHTTWQILAQEPSLVQDLSSLQANEISQNFWCPMSLMRDQISPHIDLSTESLDEALTLILPRYRKVNRERYSMRPELEEIDRLLCHVT